MDRKNIVIFGSKGLLGSNLCSKLANTYNIIPVDIVDSDQKNYLKCNILDEEQVKELFKQIEIKYDVIDGIVNASYPKGNNFVQKEFPDSLKEVNIELNNQLGSALYLSTLCIKLFMKQEKGHLVLISSIQGIGPPKFQHYVGSNFTSPIAYSAIKAGIINITKYLAKFTLGTGIQVNCISPGGIDGGQPNTFKSRYLESCNKIGLLKPDDITSMIEYLFKNNKAITGQNFVIDDGWSL